MTKSIKLNKNISYGAYFKIALTHTIHSEFWLPFNVKLDKIYAIHIILSFPYLVGNLVGTHFIYMARVTRVTLRHVKLGRR